MKLCDTQGRHPPEPRQTITVEKRVAVALWRLSTNVEYRTISHLFGIGVSTACNIVHEVCRAIVDCLLSIYVKIPQGNGAEGWLLIGGGTPGPGIYIGGEGKPYVIAPTNWDIIDIMLSMESMYFCSLSSTHFSRNSSLALCSFSNPSRLSLSLACAASTSLTKELAAFSANCTVVNLFLSFLCMGMSSSGSPEGVVG